VLFWYAGGMMTLRQACETIGKPHLVLDGPEGVTEFHDHWKFQMVNARESNNIERAKELSEAWARVKKVQGRWCSCGARKTKGARLCPLCRGAEQKARCLPQILSGVVSHDVLIPPRRSGGVREALEKLKEVGDSIVLKCHRMSVSKAAQTLKIRVTAFSVRDESRKDTGLVRVWLTDGKRPGEVNELIKARMQSEGLGAKIE
jgi:hypothetical protein